MEPIEGWPSSTTTRPVQCGRPAGSAGLGVAIAGYFKIQTMTGLAVVDDHTFTIKTSEKVSNLAGPSVQGSSAVPVHWVSP